MDAEATQPTGPTGLATTGEPSAASPASAVPLPALAGPARRRRIRRIAVAAGFIAVALLSATVLIGLALAQEDPRWWTAVNPGDPRTVELAEAVENGITSALTQVRATPAASGVTSLPETTNTPWRVFVTNEQANAWLNVRLERWLADQTEQGAIDFRWPHEVKQVQVSFEDGRIHVGARVVRPGATPEAQPRPQTLGASLRPEFGSDGSLWLTAERIEIGRLPVPASWVLGSARSGKPSAGEKKVEEVSDELARLPQTQKVIAAFKGERPVISRPVIKLADGRRVRLLSIQPQDGRLVITAQTEVHESTARK